MEKTLLQDIMEFANDCDTDELDFQLTTGLADFLERFIANTSVDDYKKMKQMVDSDAFHTLLLHTEFATILRGLLQVEADKVEDSGYLPPFAGAGSFLGRNLPHNVRYEEIMKAMVKK